MERDSSNETSQNDSEVPESVLEDNVHVVCEQTSEAPERTPTTDLEPTHDKSEVLIENQDEEFILREKNDLEESKISDLSHIVTDPQIFCIDHTAAGTDIILPTREQNEEEVSKSNDLPQNLNDSELSGTDTNNDEISPTRGENQHQESQREPRKRVRENIDSSFENNVSISSQEDDDGEPKMKTRVAQEENCNAPEEEIAVITCNIPNINDTSPLRTDEDIDDEHSFYYKLEEAMAPLFSATSQGIKLTEKISPPWEEEVTLKIDIRGTATTPKLTLAYVSHIIQGVLANVNSSAVKGVKIPFIKMVPAKSDGVVSADDAASLASTSAKRPFLHPFPYEDLFARLLSLEPFQYETNSGLPIDTDRTLANASKNDSSKSEDKESLLSACSEEENRANEQICDLEMEVEEHDNNLNDETPFRKCMDCIQCFIGYPCNGTLLFEDTNAPPPSPIEYMKQGNTETQYFILRTGNETDDEKNLVSRNACIPSTIMPGTYGIVPDFEIKYKKEDHSVVVTQEENEINPNTEDDQAQSYDEKELDNYQSLEAPTALIACKAYKLLTIIKQDIVYPTTSKEDGYTYANLVLINEMPTPFFNPFPSPLPSYSTVGIRDPRVVNRIDYYLTNFAICMVLFPSTQQTCLCLVGINPNGEKMILGSVPPYVRVQVMRDPQGAKHVLLVEIPGHRNI